MQAQVVALAALFFLASSASSQAADCLARATEKVEMGEPQDAVEALERGAQRGDERCQFMIAMWLLTGQHMARDVDSGAEWLQKAAEDGLPVAQANLGLLYASGLGVDLDKSTAAEWYKNAAEYGDPLGQAAYGTALFLGIGVHESQLNGYVWTSLAAAQGNARAQSFLPGYEQALTGEELAEARSMIAEFRPKSVSKAKRWRSEQGGYDSKVSAQRNQRRSQGRLPGN